MIGFVYLWMDSGRHSDGNPNVRKFALGSHYGPEDDGYVTGTGGRYFRAAFKKRPQDFRRRIIERIYEGDGRTVFEAEQRWLDMIKPEELNRRYYNNKKTANGFHREDILRFHEADPTLRTRMGIAISDAFNVKPELRTKKSVAMKTAHEADPTLRVRIGDGVRDAYAADPTMGKRAGTTRSATYAANPELGKRAGAKRRDNYRADPEAQKRKKLSAKTAYEKDPTYRTRVGEGVRAANEADPTISVRRGRSVSATLMARPESRRSIAEASRIAHIDSRWINNGTERRPLKAGEPLPEGWSYGFNLEENPDPRVGARWHNNGVERRQFRVGEPVPEGWKPGFKLKGPEQ